MTLISYQSAILLLISVLAVQLLPGKKADFVLALLTGYVLYSTNSLLNFIISLIILSAIYIAGKQIERTGGVLRV